MPIGELEGNKMRKTEKQGLHFTVYNVFLIIPDYHNVQVPYDIHTRTRQS